MRQRGQASVAMAVGAMLWLGGCDTSSSSDYGTSGDAVETTEAGTETAAEVAAETVAEAPAETATEVATEVPDTPAEVAALSCEAFCAADLETCAGGNQQYPDLGTCLTDCAPWPPGTLTDTGGNTLGCRIWHRAIAATSAASAVTHCPHTGPSGGGVCKAP